MTDTAGVVLVAGANGRIGSAVCRRVLASGGRVAATVRRSWQVEPLRAALGSERVLVGAIGSGDPEAAAGFVKGAQDALGPLVAFAGTAGRWQGRADGHEPGGDLQDLLAANLLANAVLARAALPHLRRRRRGVLVFAGGADAVLPAASAAFAASAGALRDYVRALALDLEGSGVRAELLPLTTTDVDDAHGVAQRIEALCRGALSPSTH